MIAQEEKREMRGRERERVCVQKPKPESRRRSTAGTPADGLSGRNLDDRLRLACVAVQQEDRRRLRTLLARRRGERLDDKILSRRGEQLFLRRAARVELQKAHDRK